MLGLLILQLLYPIPQVENIDLLQVCQLVNINIPLIYSMENAQL